MEKILLDTDIGGDIDDAICLAYLLREPNCELLGITTVCGDAETRASVADAICKAAGKTVPVVAGFDLPLSPIPFYPTPEGADALKNWPHSKFTKGSAPEFMYAKIKEAPGEITLIAIGNMTNVAVLFRDHPDAAALLKGLYVMNGYFGSTPLPEPLYNWNSWADPTASKLVFCAQPPVHKVIPLEVTDMLTVDADRAHSLFDRGSRLMQAVLDFGSAWLRSSGKLTLHDPLAAISLFYPDICSYERGFVRVETENEADMGGTRFSASESGNVEIARTVDKERFYRILSKSFNS